MSVYVPVEGGQWPRGWSQPVEAEGETVSFRQVIKQGGTQRLRSLEKHHKALAAVATALAPTTVCAALREVCVELLVAELRSSGRRPGPLLHVDWGASTGALAELLAASLGHTGEHTLTTRSFDLVPAGSGVEFGDHCKPATSPKTVDLASAVANLENPGDVAGFYGNVVSSLRCGGVVGASP